MYQNCALLVSICYRAKGAQPYVIPTGGYSAVGEFGYIEAFKEMMEQV